MGCRVVLRCVAGVLAASLVALGSRPAAGAPTVDGLAGLVDLVSGAWTDDLMVQAVPPGAILYNRDLGIVGISSAFETNVLAALTPITNGTVVLYPISVIETNTTPRERVFLAADFAPVHTAAVDVVDYPESWSRLVYGDPPPWLAGEGLDAWYTIRDPARQRVRVMLISTSDVPAYIAGLTNAIGSAGAGTNAVPLLDLYSNDIAFVGIAVSAQAASLYVHAPEDVARIDLFDSTNLTTIAGGWWLAATLEHSADPLLWFAPAEVSNAFYCAGDADVDSDGDGLSDIRELRLYGTDPAKRDTDGDGLSDGEEVLTYDLDPLDADSDDDGLSDGWEVFSALYPTDPDFQTNITVTGQFGDTSGGSTSEKYALRLTPLGETNILSSWQNAAFGAYTAYTQAIDRGQARTFNLRWLAHDLSDTNHVEVDHDYQWYLAGEGETRGWKWKAQYVIADTNLNTIYSPSGTVSTALSAKGHLGNHWVNKPTTDVDFGTPKGVTNAPPGKRVDVYVPLVDLDPANASNVVADAWLGEGVAPGTIMAVGTGNLRRVRFTRGPESMATGTVTLAIASGAERIRVWRDPAMGAGDLLLSATNPTTNWVLAGASTWTAIPTNVWVEGVTSSAASGDIALAARFSGPSGTLCADTNLFTILSVDLEIYKPKVVDPAEPMIPDADELSKGSVTFVNLDNDDNDSKFDHGGASTDDEVTGGDDELVKVKLKLKPSSLTQGQVKLLATAGAGNIAVWTNDNKAAASAYTLGTALNVPGDFAVEGDSLVKTMWAEGISAHTAQQGTKLKMEYTISGTTCEDEAALTVVGVDQITWKGKSNSLNDNDTLDADPNWPGGLTPNALRVFPDARVVSGAVEANPRDKVTAEVMLTVGPPHQIKLYLESFDTDDPTADTSPVDDEANEEDNRGTSPAKAGQFTGESGGVLELVFSENVKTTNCEFQVTMQPGDNFRIVANGDKDFLSRLENKDSASGASNADKQRICNKDVTGTLAEREVRLAADYASDTLAVWRFLHVEVDSMAAPPTTGAEKNTADGNLTGVVGNGTVAQRVNLDINLKTGFTPQDNSDNLTAGTGNGRFENGWIKIGSGGGTPGQTQTSTLLGNGDDYVRKDAGIDIPALVSKTGQSDVSGKVIAWSGSAFTLSVSSGTLSTNYNGGSLNVAGVSATITTISGSNVVNVTAAPTIPFVLHDDDAAPHPYQPNTSLMQASDSTNQNLFAAAYIRPAYDLGPGAKTNSFQRNVESTADALTQLSAGRDSTSYPRFWTAYIQGTFQGMTRITLPVGVAGDSDPNSEAGVLGITPGLNSLGALIFVETIRDSEVSGGIAAGSLLRKTTAHETGHEFGLDHEPNSIMQQGYPVPLLFAPRHLDNMRSKSNP